MSDELLVRHCSPTLAGVKTGNMFSCAYESLETLRETIRGLNRKLAKKGLRILPLRIAEKTALIYVYRPSKLKEDFSCEEAMLLLKRYGYTCDMPGKCIVKLRERLQKQEEFPHEIGLFLGYPPEDVLGFIENRARDAKCVGNWKVYGDEEAAKKRFAQYKRCTSNYISRLTKGNTIEQLTVAV